MGGRHAGGMAAPADADKTPLVIGHRGACGYRPEHTLGSYQLAIAMGADYIEPDLVPTKDGVLVCRHENELSGTTDVASHPHFASRMTTKSVDSRRVTGWFTEDFTLAELQNLRARERLPALRPINRRYDGKHHIPTFDEVLSLVELESRRRGVVIGVYPETKHPTYFESVGLSLEEPLLSDLRRHHLDRPNAEVFIQSFEPDILRRLSSRTQVKRIQLVDAARLPATSRSAARRVCGPVTATGLREIVGYAHGIGVHKALLLPRTPTGSLLQPTDLVENAHAAGLVVHAWTMRNENRFLPVEDWMGCDPSAFGDAAAEYLRLFSLGVDGVFTDFPDTAVSARREWLISREVEVAL